MTAATDRRADPETVSDASGSPRQAKPGRACSIAANDGVANLSGTPSPKYTPTRFYCPTCGVNGPADRAASHVHDTVPAGTVPDDYDPTPECTDCHGSGEARWGGICGRCAGNGVVTARGR